MGADTRMMKQINKKLLRRVLRECKEAAKPELAEKTGLSVVTINSLLEELLETGEAVQAGLAPSGGGRPGTLYRYQPDYRYAVILYGHQSQERNLIHGEVINLDGTCVWRRDEYYDEIRIGSFDKVLDEAAACYPRICLLAFGLPGEVVDDVVTVHDYEALLGSGFMEHYKERYGLPVIYENDINAMTYGACMYEEPDGPAVAGIYLPRLYPPGSGLVIGGKIYYGSDHWAGELAALPVPVSWDQLDYENEEDVLKNLEALTAIFGLVMAPETLIFYGDFFSRGLEERVKNYAEKLLEGKFRMEIIFTENLEKDYEAGMKWLALESLWEDN